MNIFELPKDGKCDWCDKELKYKMSSVEQYCSKECLKECKEWELEEDNRTNFN